MPKEQKHTSQQLLAVGVRVYRVGLCIVRGKAKVVNSLNAERTCARDDGQKLKYQQELFHLNVMRDTFMS